MRPGTKTLITKFPPQPSTTVPPVQPILPPNTAKPTLTQTPPYLPVSFPFQPLGNSALPPEIAAQEPIQIDPNLTIDELIELRRIIGSKDPRYWAAHDEIQKKRDIMYEIHLNSQLKAFQDLTIALYTVNKLKVPETVGKPFQSD